MERPEIATGVYVLIGGAPHRVLKRRHHTCDVAIGSDIVLFPVTELVVTDPPEDADLTEGDSLL